MIIIRMYKENENYSQQENETHSQQEISSILLWQSVRFWEAGLAVLRVGGYFIAQMCQQSVDVALIVFQHRRKTVALF